MAVCVVVVERVCLCDWRKRFIKAMTPTYKGMCPELAVKKAGRAFDKMVAEAEGEYVSPRGLCPELIGKLIV